MITLMYVKGISMVDTLKWKTVVERNRFFRLCPQTQIPDSYYPPHYKNIIKVDRQYLDLSNNYNYAVLEYDNKKYFYFVDAPYYINDDLISLTLTMDTIQTYYFDITFNYSYVSRNTIKRWVNNTINRDYIRENISETEMYAKDVQYFNHNILMGYLVYNMNEGIALDCSYNTPSWADREGIYTKDIEDINGKIAKTSSISSFVIPIFNLDFLVQHTPTIEFNYVPLTTAVLTEDISYTAYIRSLIELFNSPYLDSIAFTKFCYIDEISSFEYDNTNNKVVINTSAMIYRMMYRTGTGSGAQDNFYQGIYIGCDKIKFSQPKTLSFGFTKNTSLNTTFNKNYCPQLLDSNYYHLLYGEKMFETTYPLERSNVVNFKCYKSYDYDMGKRLFYIKAENDTFDKYKTMVQNCSYENTYVKNDSYLQFQANNYSSLTRGIALQNFNATNKMASGLIHTITGVGSNMAQTQNNVNNINLKQQYSKDPYNYAYYGEYGSAVSGYGSAMSEMKFKQGLFDTAFGYMQDTYNTLQNMLIAKENASSAPDSTKIGNCVNLDIMSENLNEILEIYECEDIDDVARRFEFFGYKVDKFTKTNLLIDTNDEFNSRHYFNFIQVKEINISITNSLVGYNIINDIRERFKAGLRLWKCPSDNIQIYNEIGDAINYDNVEEEVL